MILVKICVEVFPHKRREFKQAAQWLVQSGEDEKGSISKSIYQELGEKNCFYYLEEWECREDFEAHRQSDKFRALIGGMKVLGEITEAKLTTCHNEEALDLLN